MGEVIPLSQPPRGAARTSLGMKLFLLSWSVSFIGLFIAVLWVRARAMQWPPVSAPELPLLLPTLASIVVLWSSVAAQAVLWAVRAGRRSAVRGMLVATLVLGLLFLLLQGAQWRALWGAGLRLPLRQGDVAWNPAVAYAGCFYAMTLFHALHVLSGLVVMGWLTPALWQGRVTARTLQPVRMAVWFWHFVTVAWFGVWLLAYLV